MTYTEKRLEEIKQIIYGNARKGAVTDDLNQIIGFRTGEGLEFENLAKGLTEYVEDEIHQAEQEMIERVGDKWKLAKFMHERYEKYAFIFGWNTQEKTKVPFEDLPEENKKTMLAVAQDIISLQDINR